MKLAPYHTQKHSYEVMEKALRLHAEGRSYRAIGRQLDVPWHTVRKWLDGSTIRASRLRLKMFHVEPHAGL